MTDGSPLVVAVSGGSDSMALCFLLKQWCQERGYELHAVTVDHGLRAEAAEEAILVGEWCASAGIFHTILTGDRDKPQTGIQAYARDLRYDLLLKACESLGSRNLFLGHQQEDQIETFLMRYSRGSGLPGLTAMQQVSMRGDTNLHRPMLSLARQELREYLLINAQDWIEDPSNEDERYTRTALSPIRQKISRLPGASAASLCLSLERMARANTALEEITKTVSDDIVHVSPLGFVTVEEDKFRGQPQEIQIRLLDHMIRTVRGRAAISVRLSELERLESELPATRTLGGCKVFVRQGNIYVIREFGRDKGPELPVGVGEEGLWDDRFLVFYQDKTALEYCNVRVCPIGHEGWQQIGKEIPEDLKNLPAVIRNQLPVVKSNEEIVAAPLIFPEKQGTGIASDRYRMVFHSKIVLN
ncbi:MAG: tRNA lysidine(34) synthetase TilS [Sneathiella sp.]|nr:tRNA lysidine(34) synthetase TilS [Sneathiella sp.]